jgi:hypothetical protein
MIPKYVPILKAKKGEFDAFKNLPDNIQINTLPVFELPTLSTQKLGNSIYSGANNPREIFINTCASEINSSVKSKVLGVDIHSWPANATIENGDHILSTLTSCLSSYGFTVMPVIGYDRWEDEEYSTVLKLLSQRFDRFILRLDSYAFEDMIEEDLFLETLEDIISSMGLDSSKCSVILDFGDVSKENIIDMNESIDSALNLLNDFGFSFVSIAGCSITPDINDMVSQKNSTGIVVRKEFKVWKSVRKFAPKAKFVFGDYGISSPSLGDDIIAPDAHGKIRYTVSESYYVLRGYSRRTGEKGAQMHKLCQDLISSSYYFGSSFSWGDERIYTCANFGVVSGKKPFVGNPTSWVSIDTNHHIKYVVQEVTEFEQSLNIPSSLRAIPQ